jgi:hypothetical protein
MIRSARNFRARLLLLILLALTSILAGCASEEDPADAVEGYYKALVEKDRDKFMGLACAGWEGMALMDFDSFGAVDASLVDLACEKVEGDGDAATVTCTGDILVEYEGEDNELFALDDYTYTVIKENGEWQMCGYE